MRRSCWSGSDRPCKQFWFTKAKRVCRNLQTLDFMVGMTRFELATPCSRSRCATRLRYIPKNLFSSLFEEFCQGGRRREQQSECRVVDPDDQLPLEKPCFFTPHKHITRATEIRANSQASHLRTNGSLVLESAPGMMISVLTRPDDRDNAYLFERSVNCR